MSCTYNAVSLTAKSQSKRLTLPTCGLENAQKAVAQSTAHYTNGLRTLKWIRIFRRSGWDSRVEPPGFRPRLVVLPDGRHNNASSVDMS